MAIWFMRVSAAICLAAIALVLGLFGRDWYREAAHDAAYAAAEEHVQSLGGSLSLDVEQHDFIIMLPDTEVGDKELAELVVLLQPLAAGASPSPDVPQSFAFNLAGTKIGDKGMQSLATLPVAWLNLNGTQITDDGLLLLRNQRRISIVTVSETRVTQPGIDAIRGSLPHIWIPVASRSRMRDQPDVLSPP